MTERPGFEYECESCCGCTCARDAIITLRAEREKPTQSDAQRLGKVLIGDMHATTGELREIVDTFQRRNDDVLRDRIFDAFRNIPGPTPAQAIKEAFASIRAEGSAEREKLLRDSAERFPATWRALRQVTAENAELRAERAKLEAALGTEQTMHAAWRKRAEEVEQRFIAAEQIARSWNGDDITATEIANRIAEMLLAQPAESGVTEMRTRTPGKDAGLRMIGIDPDNYWLNYPPAPGAKL